MAVATAALPRAGHYIVSQRDFRTLGLLQAKLGPAYTPDPDALGHHEYPRVVANLR